MSSKSGCTLCFLLGRYIHPISLFHSAKKYSPPTKKTTERFQSPIYTCTPRLPPSRPSICDPRQIPHHQHRAQHTQHQHARADRGHAKHERRVVARRGDDDDLEATAEEQEEYGPQGAEKERVCHCAGWRGLTDVGVEKGLILSRVVRALGHGERVIHLL